ncbi:hypothetical protein PLA106_17984 [Pseudomonas amygdali pv. lachrymans str. M302278]|nr:hypothetical protein PLA106_17984 [Pseudomonas amygdali pv. lachrymans str. M302278]
MLQIKWILLIIYSSSFHIAKLQFKVLTGNAAQYTPFDVIKFIVIIFIISLHPPPFFYISPLKAISGSVSSK